MDRCYASMSDLCHLVIQPLEEFVFWDHDAFAELDLGEAVGMGEFVGVCPGDAQELRHLGDAEHNGQLFVRCVGFHSFIFLSNSEIKSVAITVLPQPYRYISY